jgi:hypothetical protein
LKHYETSKELNLRGKVYEVTAAWDKRSQVCGGSAIGSARVVCNDDINDLLGLADKDVKPVSTDVSQWIDTLFDFADAQPLETSKECRGSFLQMLWDGASVESEGDAAASAISVFSSDSESDAPVDVEADLIQFSDECAQDLAPLSAVEATPATFGDLEELWTLPAVSAAAEGTPEAEGTAPSLPLPPADQVGCSNDSSTLSLDHLCGEMPLDEAGVELKASLIGTAGVIAIQPNLAAS